MSDLTDYIVSRPGLVGLWAPDGASGTTTITDLGPNGLHATERNASQSRLGLGATGFVNGHATCWESDPTGVNARGWTLAAAANATMQLQTLTGFMFHLQTAANNPPTTLLGRQNGMLCNVNSLRRFGVAASGGGVTLPARTNPSVLSLNVGHLVGYTYDGEVMQPYVDGVPEGSYARAPGPFSSFLNVVVMGGDTGQVGAGHKVSVFGFFNRKLDAEEWRQMRILGLGDLTAEHQAAMDFSSDVRGAFITNGAEDVKCRSCGGRRRVTEGGVKQATPTRHSHHPCFGAKNKWRAVAARIPTSGSDPFDTDCVASFLVDSILDNYTTRGNNDSPYYLGTDGRLMSGASEVSNANYGGLLGAAGLLHWYWGGGPAGPNLQRMRLIMGYLRANQIPVGQTKAGWFSNDGTFATEWGGNGVFTLNQMLPGVIAVWKDLDVTTRGLWLDTLRRAADALWDWELAQFWANGNVVINIWGCFAMMAVLDPTQSRWQTRADAYKAYLFAPSGSFSYAGGSFASIGCRRNIDGTPANDPLISLATMRTLNVASDGIYVTEGTSATATGPGNTNNTTYGRDWNYTMAACDLTMAIFLITGDTDAEKMMQLFANTVQPRHNMTNGTVTGPSGGSVSPWQSDYRQGTRHNLAEPGVAFNLHTLRRYGRTDLLSEAQAADYVHLWLENDAVLNTTQQNVHYRFMGNIALCLLNSPYKPELVI